MENRGFILVDILVGFFILGILVVASIPLLGSTYSNYSSISALTEMNYLGESIYERLSSKDDYSNNLLDELVANNEVIFDDLSDEYLEKYEASIFKSSHQDNFIEIIISIKSRDNGGNIKDVEFKGSILR